MMKKMIYTIGYIDDNGDIVLKGAYRDGDTDNLVFVTIGNDRISADVIQAEAGTPELPAEMIADICGSHKGGRCPLDYHIKPYDKCVGGA